MPEPKRLGDYSPQFIKDELELIGRVRSKREFEALGLPSGYKPANDVASELALVRRVMAEKEAVAVAPTGRTIGGTLKDIAVTGAKGVVGLGEAVVGLADIPTLGRAGKAMEDYLGYDPETTQEFLGKYYSPAQKAAFAEVEKAKGFVGTIKAAIENPSTIGHSFIQTFPLMLGGAASARTLLGIGMKSPLLAGALGEGIISAGAAAEETRQQTKDGLLTPKQAALTAISGAGTAMFALAGGRVATKFGIIDPDVFLAGGSSVTPTGIIKRIVGGGISEGVFEELPQSMQEQVWLNAALDKPLLEGVSEAGATGMLTGMAMGSGFNVFTGKPYTEEDIAPPTETAAKKAKEEAKKAPKVPAELIEAEKRQAAIDREFAARRTPEERQAEIEAEMPATPATPMTTISEETTQLAEEDVTPEIVEEAVTPAEEIVPEAIPLVPTDEALPAPMRAMGMRPPKPAAVPFMITRETEFGLSELGYTKDDIAAMRPEDALGIVEGKIAKEPIVEEKIVEPEAPKIEIPTLTDTTQAIEFGKKATPEQIIELKRLREESETRYHDLTKEGKLDEAGEEAFRVQLYREAYEAKEKPKEPKAEKPEVIEKEKPVIKEIGQAQGIMGTAAIVADVQRKDGVDYELYKAKEIKDKSGFVRIYDSESGEVVDIKKYPTFEQAKAEYDKTREIVLAKPRPSKLPAEVVSEAVESTISPLPIPGVAPKPKKEPRIERRKDVARRKLISEMSTKEMRKELLINPVTNIPNKRAYQEAEKTDFDRKIVKAKAYIDVDSLKYVNDFAGHDAGDNLLQAVAKTIAEVTPDSYHISGDEFIIRAETEETARELADELNEKLSEVELEFTNDKGEKYTYKGLGVSYGVHKEETEADRLLRKHKEEREAEGVRAKRGERPPRLREVDTGEGRRREGEIPEGLPREKIKAKPVLPGVKPVVEEKIEAIPEKEKPAELKIKEEPVVEEKIEVSTTPEGKEITVDLTKKAESAVTPKQQKTYLLAEIDKAIEEAPKVKPFESLVEEFKRKAKSISPQAYADLLKKQKRVGAKRVSKYGTVTIHVPDDGVFTILNTKQSLEEFKKKAKKFPAVTPKAKKVIVPGVVRKVPAVETIDELLKTSGGKEFFTDGSVIIKGKPPAKAKYGVRSSTQAFIREMLATETKPAELKYYAFIDPDFGEGAAKTPIPSGLATPDYSPMAVFQAKSGKLYGYNQFRLNAITKRFPKAKYGMSEEEFREGLLVAYENKKPVAALMPIKTKGEHALMEDMAIEKGFIKALPLKKEEEPLFLMRKTATAIGASKAPTLQSEMDKITLPWKNAPIVEVVQSQSELPDVILKASKGEIVDGVYYKGTVYIVADNTTSQEAAVKTLLHESFGHYGMRELLGKDFGEIMNKVYIAKRAEVVKIADEYGYDIKSVKDRVLAADEWLAREAVSNPESSWVKKVISAIRQFVRRIMPSLKLSNAEIQQLLEDAKEYVERGRAKVGIAGTLFEEPGFQMAGVSAAEAPMAALFQAETMLKEGKSKEEVWEKTGWLKGVEGKWKFEIDDSTAKLDVDKYVKGVGRPVKLYKILDHPLLFKAYPSLMNLEIIREDNTEFSGSYNEYNNRIKIGGGLIADHAIKETLFHEIQHAIQKTEGFAEGGTPAMFKGKAPDFDIIAQAKELRAFAEKNNLTIDEVVARPPRHLRHIIKQDAALYLARNKTAFEKVYEKALQSQDPHKSYRRLAGEIEARDTAARAKLTPEQRRAQLPYRAEGIPEDRWIIKKGEGTSFSVEEVKKLTPAEKARRAFKVLGIKPELKPEEPLPKRARSVGLAYQDISEEAKRLEVEIGLEYPKVTRTHAELREQADRIMGDQEQLIKTMEKKKNFSEAEGLVIDRAATEGLETLMKIIATKDIEKAQKMHKTFKAGIGNKMQDVHSEFGRNLESLKEMVSPMSVAKAFAGLERDLNKEDMDKFNSAAEALGQDDAKPMINFQKHLKATKQDPKLMDYVYEYWYNSILSGFPTHVVNVASTTAWSAWQVAVHKPLLAAIDPFVAKFQKRPTEYYMAEIIPALAGIKRGFKPGIKGAKEMLIKGYTVDAELDKFAADMGKSVGAFSRSPNKYLKAIAPFLTMPTRALRGMDIWAKQMNYEAELGSIAKRMEKKGEGKYEELLKNPTEGMMQEASQYADYTTFMGKLGKIGTMIESLRTAVPGGRFIMPFVRTIANLVKRGVEMTPGVGAMKLLDGRVKGKEVTQVLVKQIEGAMIALIVASMFDDDEITGDTPANKAEREAFYRQGKKPWSIKIGDMWYQYRRIEPFNTPIAAVGILYDTWKRTGEEPSTEFVYRSAAGFVNNIIDSSYLSGLTQVLDSVRKADKWPQKLTNMFDRTIASFSPMSSFQRSFVRAIEAIDKEGAVLRKPKGAVETLAAATPFISEMVTARKDVWGEEVIIEGSPLAQWLPWKAARVTGDVVEKEIERLHGLGLLAYPGMPAKYMTVAGKRYDFDDDQYDKLITDSGQASKKKLDSLVGTSYWKMLSNEEKASRIKRIRKDASKRARNRIKKELGVGAIPGMVPWKSKKRKRPAWQESAFGKKPSWQKSIGF